MQLAKYSFGTGDRFGQQGSAQLAAVIKAKEQGLDLAIVWNKSQREHGIGGTSPVDVRREADEAIHTAAWKGSYHVDADHINLANVDPFLLPSDFFTIDVAEYIGQAASRADLDDFVAFGLDFIARQGGRLNVAGIAEPLFFPKERLHSIAEKYLFAVRQAAVIYHHIEAHKGQGEFITEISMDETAEPQRPDELYVILAALAKEKVPVQTIAPKFSGRFNKGVDYQEDVALFEREFSDDICVIRRAVADFGLPATLKLSVHSGSDKFSIYPGIRKAMADHDTGVHIKTAGTTWLEELIGLAECGDNATTLVKRIYRESFERFDALCQPYATVIDINRAALPAPEKVDGWSGARLAAAIRHDQRCRDYDPNLRQLLHVGYKVAAELGEEYLGALARHRAEIGRQVCGNLFERHISPLFL